MPVHYIEVQDRTAAIEGGERISAELREIGRKNRRCKFDQRGAPSL
jgi:hypothetical protein